MISGRFCASGLKAVAPPTETYGMTNAPLHQLSWSQRTASGIAQTMAWEVGRTSGDMTPAVQQMIEGIAEQAALRMHDSVMARLQGVA